LATTNNNNKTRKNHKHTVTSQKTEKEKMIVKENKPAKKNTSKKSTKRKISKEERNILGAIFVGYIIICVIVSIIYGITLGIIFAIGVGSILIISRILDTTKQNSKKRKILKTVLIILLILFIIFMIVSAIFVAYVIKEAPDFDENKLVKKESSIMYDNRGQEFARLGSHLRENVSYDDLPEVFIDALIATEDSRFFQHNGFDAPRFVIASIKQVAGKVLKGSGGNAGGASTLSMQVIKNSLTSKEDEGFEGIVRKFTDIYLAVFKLEKNYTKEQIIEFYVNNHFLGSSSYGVEQAAQTYFGKSIKDVNISEAAMLVGLFQAPGSYDPYVNPSKTYQRRWTVLNLMYKHGYITKEEQNAANAIPITSLLIGKSTRSSKYQSYIDTVIQELDEKHGINPNVTPVKIYTNMDPEKQAGIDDIFNGVTFKWPNEGIEGGVAVTDVNTGKIVAIGAGRNKTSQLTLNTATKNVRQIGSTAKPLFDYGPGIEYNNWSTYEQFIDEPHTYSNGTPVTNSDSTYKGQMSLRTALSLSRNIPAVKAFQTVDNQNIIDFVTGLGIKPDIDKYGKIYEAHALGAFDKGATPLQMATAYAAFANGGYYIEPLSVNKVIYLDTGDIETYEPEKRQAMKDSTAFLITDALITAVQSGYSSSAKMNGVNVAAKTGTTNFTPEIKRKYKLKSNAINDAWIVGYNPDYAISMWIGVHNLNTSGKYTLTTDNSGIVRGNLYQALEKIVFKRDNKEFKVPKSVVKVAVENGSNPALLPSPNTPESQIVYEYFIKGNEPKAMSTANTKLTTVSNLKVSYSKSNQKLTITWNKLNAPEANISYGEFGYNVYYGNTLLGFTTDNKYEIEANANISGTYKVVTTFKNYSNNQSDPAVYIFNYNNSEGNNDENPPSPSPSPSKDTYTASLNGNNPVNITLGGTYTDPDTPLNFKKNGVIINDQISINDKLIAICYDPSGNQIATSMGGGLSFTANTPGTYTIEYTLSYSGNTYNFKRVIKVN